MPTGYTADIKNGIDFKTYAMNCARAFGACVTLRDEPGGGDRIPDVFEPTDHYLKAMEQARHDLTVLDAMTPDELERAAARLYDDTEASRLGVLEAKRKARAAYEAMLEKVNAWIPPTPGHVELQKFMRTQIEESIEFDCGVNSYPHKPTVRLTGEVWAAMKREQLTRNMRDAERDHAIEMERAEQRTAWVRALRNAL